MATAGTRPLPALLGIPPTATQLPLLEHEIASNKTPGVCV
jgi:hypothetical protein